MMPSLDDSHGSVLEDQLLSAQNLDSLDPGDGEDQKGDDLDHFKQAHPLWYYELPKYPSAKDYVSYPFHSASAYVRRLRGNFGHHFVIMLTCAYFGVKGCLSTFIYVGQLPYFQKYMGLDGADYQIYSTVAQTPWAVKALMGTVSDAIPIFGYHKRYYIVFASIVGTIGFALVAALPLDRSSAAIAALLFMLGHFQLALVDLLCEGKYAELMVKHPHTSSDVVSWVWGMVSFGSLVSAAAIGPLADAGYIRSIYWICVPLAAQVIIPTLLGYLPEERLPVQRRGIQWAKLRTHQSVFVLALLMAGAAFGLALANLFGNRIFVLVYSVLSSTLLVLVGFKVLPHGLAACNLYMFLAQSTHLGISGALDYYYTATPDCVPGGPAFDYTYYNTWSSIAQSIFGAVGVALFQATMSKWEFRPVFWVTATLRIAAGLVDIIIIERWNKAVGLSDKVTYMLGYNIIVQVVYMMDFMPAVVLTSKLCPKSLESTVYALLAGFQNFGGNVSRSVGVYMIEAFGIKTTVPCNFDNLTYLVVVCHMLLPLLHIPLTFILIPKARLTDRILDHNTSLVPHDDGHTPQAMGERNSRDNLNLLETGDMEMDEISEGYMDSPHMSGLIQRTRSPKMTS
eukprot:comp7493_c0_seq1/m.3156 comp7493_c0_seq1/g.3156  ORF comp7493_c0_seq1/g.3156 comp7493_c0_seq1/m.3156 type:complete len:624 (-) comp7493_c0_seq1:377-2248(-)